MPGSFSSHYVFYVQRSSSAKAKRLCRGLEGLYCTRDPKEHIPGGMVSCGCNCSKFCVYVPKLKQRGGDVLQVISALH